MALRDTIRELTRNHLDNHNGMILGQCLTAVGWVDNTVPNTKNVFELPLTDVAGADIAVGCAVAGRRPILVIRFQDFLMLNGNALVYFAAKRKECFGKSVPIFVRAMAREGSGAGNSHSGRLHSVFCHFPGLRCYAPVTPGEYTKCWNDFMNHDDPAICFEHRSTMSEEREYPSVIKSKSRITVIGISLAKVNAYTAVSELERQGIDCDFINIVSLKPLDLTLAAESLKKTGTGIVIDTGHETCGMARDIAYQLMHMTGSYVFAKGIGDYSSGCRSGCENLTPDSDQIIEAIKCCLSSSRV